jgi:hypothetical protein
MEDYDLWIWHDFFGMAGSHNNIKVLQCSPVFTRIVKGHAPAVNYVIVATHSRKGTI